MPVAYVSCGLDFFSFFCRAVEDCFLFFFVSSKLLKGKWPLTVTFPPTEFSNGNDTAVLEHESIWRENDVTLSSYPFFNYFFLVPCIFVYRELAANGEQRRE